MNKSILQIEELNYYYDDGTHALKDISLSIRKGSKIAVVGPNGAGKTTLLLHFNGIYKPSEGRLILNEKIVEYSRKHIKELRKTVGIVFQDPNSQLFSASVSEEISFGLVNLGLSKDEVMDRTEEVMTSLNIKNISEKPTHFLSGGEKKKVAIASILAMRPEIVVFDEPLANLDPKSAKEIMKILDKINCEGKTVVISTHDVNNIYSWAEYILIMDNGQLIKTGKPEEVFADSKILEKSNLEKPWIIEVFEELIELKPCLKNKYSVPKTKEELFSMLKDIK